MHRIALERRIEVRESKLALEVFQQKILNYQDQVFVEGFEGLHLMMQLDENSLGSHFPIHAVGLVYCLLFTDHIHTNEAEVFLSGRPYRSSCIQGLQFYIDKISDLGRPRRNEKLINAPAGDNDFRNDV